MTVLDPKGLFNERVAAIKAYHEETGVPRAELDLSGGIDSAVMACLLAAALGPDKITLVHSRFKTASTQTERAQRLAKALEIPLIDFKGEAMFDALMASMKDAIVKAHGSEMLWHQVNERVQADPTILGSIRSCLRAPIGRGFNRLMGNGIRHGTGNECEDRFIRFYQKGGDGEVDTNPLEMLSKTEVYQLAWACGEYMDEYVKHALRPIIEALPSPDLWGTGDGHSDEDELKSWLGVPFTYGRVDPDTGKVIRFGTIERVARFLDKSMIEYVGQSPSTPGLPSVKASLFHHEGLNWSMYITVAKESGLFNDFSRSDVEAFLMVARKAERATRHKENPAIPTLGSRAELVGKGLLTNELTL